LYCYKGKAGYDFGGRDQEVDGTRRAMPLNGDVIGEIESFKYFGSFVQRDGGFGMDVKHRIKRGWMKWREASGVLCDIREFQ